MFIRTIPQVLWNNDGGGGAGGGTPSGGAGPAGGGTPAPAGNPAGGGGTPTPAPAGGAPGSNLANPFPTLKPNHQAGNPGGNNPPPTPDPNAPPAGEPKPYEKYHGAPEGGNYADIKVPEGYTLDKALVDKFLPIANKFNLSQEGAQELADFYVKEILGPQSAAFIEQISNWYTETEKDAEIGGAKFEASTQNASRALSVFGTPGLKQLMVQYGIGNHPEVVRFFARVGSALPAEDNAAGGKPGSPQGGADFLTKMYGPPKA